MLGLSKIKKYGTIALTCAALLAASACGSGSDSAGPDGQVTVSIQEWSTIPGTPMEEVINNFQQEHPDIKIKVLPQIPFGPEYDTRMQTQLGSGNAPTIFRMNDDFLTSFSQEGVLKDLKPYFDDLNGDELLQPLYEFGEQSDGTYTGLAIGTGPRVIFYNKDLFEKEGVPLPPSTYTDENWTWDEFLAAAKKFTVPGERWGAIVFTDEGFENTWSINNGSKTGVFSEDGRTFTLSEPDAAGGIQFVADLSCKEKVQPPWSELLPDEASEQYFADGKVAMLHGAFATNTGIEQLVDGRFEYDIAPVPGNVNHVNENSLYVYSVPESTPDEEAEAAAEFLKYLAGEEAGKVLAAGNYYVPINSAAAGTIKGEEGKPPESMEVLTGSAEGGVVPNFPPTDASLAKQLYRPALETAYSCERTVQDVLNEVKPEVDKALAEK